MTASRAWVAAMKAGSCLLEPWCGTFRTSARRSTPVARMDRWDLRLQITGEQEPQTCDLGHHRDAGVVLRRAFTCGGRGPGRERRNPSRPERGPTDRADCAFLLVGDRPDRYSVLRGQSRRRACTPLVGERYGVTSISPTVLSRSTPAKPPAWSAWKWVSTTTGTCFTPSSRKHRLMAAGSGPVSTTTAVLRPACSTRPSPCPTSQATMCQSAGGQPSERTGRSTAIATTVRASSIANGRASRRCRPSTSARQSSVSTATPITVAGQALEAPGRSAPFSAMRMIHRAGQPASQPTRRARSALSKAIPAARSRGSWLDLPQVLPGGSPRPPPARPGRTATPPPAYRQFGRPVDRRRPLRNAGATSAPRHHANSVRAGRCPLSPRRTTRSRLIWRATYPAASNAITATERLRTARRCPPPPVIAAKATRPITAALRTLGCGRASTTNTTTMPSPTTVKPRARTPMSRASGSTNANNSVRFVPETADRWVSPVVLKSSANSGGSPTRLP